MGLKSVVQKAAQTAMKATGDALGVCTYWSMSTSGSGYSPSKDEIVNKGTPWLSISFVEMEFKQEEIDGDKVKKEDKKVLIASLDLSTVPKNGDRLEVSSTEQWKVEGVATDPVQALWILHVRRATVLSIVTEF